MKGLLHIYAQTLWHDEASIVGSREGLEALRDAINAALHDDRDGSARERGAAASRSVFAEDGEGYRVLVVVCSDGAALRLPYTDTSMGVSTEGLTPLDLLGRERYRELLTGKDADHVCKSSTCGECGWKAP